MKRLFVIWTLLAVAAGGTLAQDGAPVAGGTVVKPVGTVPEALANARQAVQTTEAAYAAALAKAAPTVVELDAKIAKARADLGALQKERTELVKAAEKSMGDVVTARDAAREAFRQAVRTGVTAAK